MQKIHHTSRRAAGFAWLPIGIAVTLSACGGGDGGQTASSSTMASGAVASGVTTLALDTPSMPPEAAALLAQPAFHAAPLLLEEPDDTDALDHSASAQMKPRTQALPAGAESLSTRQMTVQKIEAGLRARAQQASNNGSGGGDGSAKPMAASTTVSTYSPAQIRAAYGLPALPTAGASISAAMAARLGAGQTIYIVNAKHNPNVIAELAAFNTKFGLPACTTKTIAVTATLPLAPASATACEISVVYNNAAGGMTANAPAYDAGWATEIALDVQWAHATAPLARIVLIEAADASLNSLLGGVKLANAMGPGVVSMSFGANEGSYTASVDGAFGAANMTYLAATGDSGAAVSWPSVSPKVLAVGGTTLSYTGSGARAEVAWSGTGGGASAYVPAPSYQTKAVPGAGLTTFRTVADVAFNADPSSGQYTAVMAPGSTAVKWMSMGGTSLATPQWAGLVAIGNAVRAQAAKPALGAAHAFFYNGIGAVPGTYAAAFADVVQGKHGTCGSCTAQRGYDQLTGLGTPNVESLLNTFANGGASASAPVVTSAAITGQVGTALSFTVSATASGAMSYALTNAPSGMVVSAAGAVTWPAPVAGTYTVTATATDSKSGLSGKGVYTVKIEAPLPPVVSPAAITGKVGTALAYTVSASNSKPVTYALVNAPAGMVISSTGAVSWPKPVAGTYAVTATAKDTVTGLSGQAVYTVAIAAESGTVAPVVSGATVSGKAGTALSFKATTTAPNSVAYTLSGQPSGMTINTEGMVSWSSPAVGSYSVVVTAKDTKTGLSGVGTFAVKIEAATASTELVITAPAVSGVVGKAAAGSISVAAPGVTSLSLSIDGAPMGMTFSMSGGTVNMAWASPALGSYSLKVKVIDSLGRTAAAVVPITISAK